MAKENKILIREILFLIALLVFALAVRLPHMNDPLDRDEGVYAYAAARMAAGDLPYRDVFDHKPPFIYYIYRAAFDLSGASDTSIRNFTTGYVILTALLVYMFARAFAGAAAAMLASFFYCIFMNTGTVQGFSSNPEIFTQFFMVFSMFFLLDRDRTYEKANFFISGFLMAAAFLTQTMLVFTCFMPLVYILCFVREKSSRRSGLIWYSLGLFTLLLLAVLWAVKNGMLAQFLEANINYNIFYAALRERAAGTWEMMRHAAGKNVLLAAAFLYSAASPVFKKGLRENFSLFMAAFSVLAGIAAVKGAYAHYYAALVPFLAISAAFMVKDAAAAALKLRSGRAAATAAVLLITAAGVIQAVNLPGILRPVESAQEYKLREEARSMGLQLKNLTGGKGSLFEWPNEPQIYFYSGMKCSSRFVNAFPYGYYSGAFSGVLDKLMADPPDYFVIRKNTGEIVFEKLVKKYYSKTAEGPDLLLYKKGGIQ